MVKRFSEVAAIEFRGCAISDWEVLLLGYAPTSSCVVWFLRVSWGRNWSQFAVVSWIGIVGASVDDVLNFALLLSFFWSVVFRF